MKTIQVVADADYWAFAKIARALQKHIPSYHADWKVEPCYTYNGGKVNPGADAIIYLLDYDLKPLLEAAPDPVKVLFALRSNVRGPQYADLGLHAKTLLASNKDLKKRFEKLHPNVVYAPGGVDPDVFKYKPRETPKKFRVGWAGSVAGWGEEFRGMPIIKKACEKLDIEFRPALKEDRLRSEREMVEYYHNEIDIYVDMSKEAGRQNGILEAAACGLPAIMSNAGFAEDYRRGNNAIVCDRNCEALSTAIMQVVTEYEKYSQAAYHTAITEWNWHRMTNQFVCALEWVFFFQE